ncbi:hypothetical protein MTR_6g464700 [Medicago truncatula]|uniref:Uncharacterized protein n=1 Tax=Medicago truncatula TaxID=3880 RepID=A0A072UA95_MEDTR|nr:hypothetical protein MTR_6g464700 [Medicago truncatula]
MISPSQKLGMPVPLATRPCHLPDPFLLLLLHGQAAYFDIKAHGFLWNILVNSCLGLEKWLIVHTFYNSLSYTTKMTVDAAAGGALMNKNYTEAYALIEEMA